MEKLMIAMPCMETMPVMTCQSIVGLARPAKTDFVFSIGSLVHDSRNKLAAAAVEHGASHVLWIDSDMKFDPDLLMKMEAAMEESGADMVSAMCRMRKPPYSLVQYSRLEEKEDGSGWITEPLTEVPEGVQEIEACGFGGVLMKTELLEKVRQLWPAPFDMLPGLGEDLAFCLRAKTLGAKIVCDGRIKMGHIGPQVTEV